MKKILMISFAVSFLVMSCTKDHSYDDERPDSRLGRLMDEYAEILVSAENGWIGYLFPEGGGGYTFKLNFDKGNRVKMYATLGENYATTPKESSYRLSAYQLISLAFDSYSYIHLLSDPDPDVFGGVVAEGYKSDFEFAVIDVTQDTIKLLGNHNGSELLLVRANGEQGDNYIAEVYDYVQQINKVNQFAYYYNKIALSGRDYGITINTNKSTVSFYYDSLGTFRHFSTEYALFNEGFILRKPFVDRDLTVHTISNFDFANNQANVTVNGQSVSQIVNQGQPVVVDKDAPRRMYIESYDYISADGFNFNGVIDAFGVKGTPGFTGIWYTPRYYVDNYDLTYMPHSSGQYGVVFRTAFNSDGVMNFSNYLGISGTAPGGNYTAAFQNTASVWIDGQGFYAYQTGSKGYDLVLIADPRFWIRFN